MTTHDVDPIYAPDPQAAEGLADAPCSAEFANILEALGSIVETRVYLQQALRESEIVLTKIQALFNSKRESPNSVICRETNPID